MKGLLDDSIGCRVNESIAPGHGEPELIHGVHGCPVQIVAAELGRTLVQIGSRRRTARIEVFVRAVVQVTFLGIEVAQVFAIIEVADAVAATATRAREPGRRTGVVVVGSNNACGPLHRQGKKQVGRHHRSCQERCVGDGNRSGACFVHGWRPNLERHQECGKCAHELPHRGAGHLELLKQARPVAGVKPEAVNPARAKSWPEDHLAEAGCVLRSVDPYRDPVQG